MSFLAPGDEHEDQDPSHHLPLDKPVVSCSIEELLAILTGDFGGDDELPENVVDAFRRPESQFDYGIETKLDAVQELLNRIENDPSLLLQPTDDGGDVCNCIFEFLANTESNAEAYAILGGGEHSLTSRFTNIKLACHNLLNRVTEFSVASLYHAFMCFPEARITDTLIARVADIKIRVPAGFNLNAFRSLCETYQSRKDDKDKDEILENMISIVSVN